MKWTWTGKTATLKQVKEQVGKGWGDIIERLVSDLKTLGWDGQVTQVKEKFGGLRFYIEGGSAAIFERIQQAEKEANKTCERCGKPGTLDKTHYWVVTNCPECRVLVVKRHASQEVRNQ